MPKIIENLKQRLMDETARQLASVGYGDTTVRSVAAACGVGIGTVYNYFHSKDALVAACLLEDWKDCMKEILAVSAGAETPKPVARCICEQLRAFSSRHEALFDSARAAGAAADGAGRYHALLRGRLAAPLRKFCDSDFAAQFAAEALLAWTMEGRDFESIYALVGRVLEP